MVGWSIPSPFPSAFHTVVVRRIWHDWFLYGYRRTTKQNIWGCLLVGFEQKNLGAEDDVIYDIEGLRFKQWDSIKRAGRDAKPPSNGHNYRVFILLSNQDMQSVQVMSTERSWSKSITDHQILQLAILREWIKHGYCSSWWLLPLTMFAPLVRLQTPCPIPDPAGEKYGTRHFSKERFFGVAVLGPRIQCHTLGTYTHHTSKRMSMYQTVKGHQFKLVCFWWFLVMHWGVKLDPESLNSQRLIAFQHPQRWLLVNGVLMSSVV